MKKIIYVLLCVAICFGLVACGDDADSGASDNVTISEVKDIAEYKIIRAESASRAETKVASDLYVILHKMFDTIQIKTDFDETSSSTKEILIGLTNRQESIEASQGLRSDDYVVKKVGNKIVIAGGSVTALRAAVDLINENFIDTEAKTVKMPTGDGYKHVGSYVIDKLTVDGVDLSEFRFYNNSLLSATENTEKISSAFGVSFAIDEIMSNSEKYIILDGTGLIADEYSITIENGNIVIKGSAHSLSAAVDTFIGSYIENLGAKEYNLSSADNFTGSTGKKEVYTKDQLMTVIEQVYDDPDKIIIGEQVQGKNATIVEDCIQQFVDATGEMPGIMGIDLAHYGFDLTKTNDLLLSSYICDLVDYAAGGGMITASAHWENPSQTDTDRVRGNFGTVNSLEAYEKNFTDLITEGTEYNEFFKNELAINARFLKALEDNGVPIIWRPLHEANGGWFWFGTRQNEFTLDPEYVVNVWQYIYEYFTEECGLTNLLWCYGPNVSGNVDDDPSTTMSTTYLYPGDEYCDMVGVDWYSSGNLEIMKGDNYLRLVDLARKPGAITEFGPAGEILAEIIEEQPELYNSMDLYGNLYELVKEGYSFAYVLTWGGKWGIPAMGRGDEFMDTNLMIGQAEVKAMFDALK